MKEDILKENDGNIPGEPDGQVPGGHDYMVRALGGDGGIRAFSVTSRNLVEEARRIHGTSNVVTAALGRTLSAALMMGDMLKEDGAFLTIRFDGDGPAGPLVVSADHEGNVRGMVQNPLVLLPLKPDGHLDVGAAVGHGTLTVIRDLDRENTYSGNISIYSGEIGEDLTHYFAESEQVPSSVGLGVLVSSKEHSVLAAGGFLIQLMPGASDEAVTRLEENIRSMPSVTELLSRGSSPEEMLEIAMRGLSPRILGTKPVRYHCECSHDRFSRALKLLGRKELDSMLREKRPQELVCRFCGRKYQFSIAELEALRAELGPQ